MERIIKNKQLLEWLNSRYAVKKFDKNTSLEKGSEDLVKDVLRLTPTSFWLQLYKFIVVKDDVLRKKLKDVSWGQGQITDSDFIVVFCIHEDITRKNLEEHSENIQKIRKTSDEEKKDFTDFMDKTILQWDSLDAIKYMDEWQAKQAYIALGNIMTWASLVWIDTCPIEGMDCKKYDEILWLKKLWLKSKVVLAVWKRSVNDDYQNKEKVRFSKEDLFIEM